MFLPYPPSLCKALDHSNSDHQSWLNSYDNGKQGIIDHDIYYNISKSQYLSLKQVEKIPKSIPSMCSLVVKNDKDVKPLRAKSRIVVIGNFEDIICQKSQSYAPVLKYSYLHILTSK